MKIENSEQIEKILRASTETIRCEKERISYNHDCFLNEINLLLKLFSLKQLNMLNYTMTFKGNQSTLVYHYPRTLLEPEKLVQLLDYKTESEAIQRVSKKVVVID